MKRRTILQCLAAGIISLGSCQAPTAQFAAQDEATLRAMFDSVASEVGAGRWETWVGHYAEDAILQPPNAPMVKGRAALLAWGKAFPAVEQAAFSDVRVSGEGNLAYGTSAYALKLKDLPLDTGKQLVVFRRSAGGAWAVHAVSFSSDLPAAAQPPPTARPN